MILKKGMDFKDGQVFFLLDDFVRRNGVGSDAEGVVVQHTIDE